MKVRSCYFAGRAELRDDYRQSTAAGKLGFANQTLVAWLGTVSETNVHS